MAHFKCSSYTNYNNLWVKISCTQLAKVLYYMSLKPNKTKIFIAFVFSEFCAILEKNFSLAWPHLSTNGNNSIHVQ